MENYLRESVTGVFWIFLFGSVAYIFSYVTRLILARYLSIEEFGLFFAMLSLLVFLTVVRDAGLGYATAKVTAESFSKKNFSKIKTAASFYFVSQIILSIVLVSILFVLSRSLAIHYFKVPEIVWPFRLFLLYFFSTPFLLTAKALLQGLRNLKGFASAVFAKNLFTLLLLLLFLKKTGSVLAPIYSYTLGGLLGFTVLLFPLYKYRYLLKHRIKNVKSTAKEMVAFGLPVMFVGFGEMVISYIDIILLTYFVSLTEVGIYNAILPTAMMFLFFGRSFSGVVFPTVVTLWGKGDKSRVSVGLRLLYTYMVVLILPIIITFFVYSKEAILILFGSAFLPGDTAFRILLIGVVFYTVAQLNNAILSGIGKPSITAKIILSVAAINFVLNLILIPRFSLLGAAFATSISYLIALAISYNKVRTFIKTQSPLKSWIKTVALSKFLFSTFLDFSSLLIHANSFSCLSKSNTLCSGRRFFSVPISV